MKNILKYIFPLAYGLLVYATVRLVQDTQTGFHFWERPLNTNLIEVSLSILTGAAIIYIIRRICRYHDRHRPASRVNSSLILREAIMVIIANALLVNIVLTPMAMLTDDGLSWADFTDINIIPLLYVLIYYGVVRSGMFLDAYIKNQLMVERLTNDKLETELKFLKAQYHPHFLFNALNTVYFQMDEDVAAAKISIEKLSELLRYQLYNQHQHVHIGQELQYLNSFIELQKVRSTRRLKLTVYFDKALNEQPVYPLLLMPLVENAFKYLGGGYEIDIHAHLVNNLLAFTVQNSIPETNSLPLKAGGIGLENLQRRLELLYPNCYQFDILKTDHNFTAKLQLPLYEK